MRKNELMSDSGNSIHLKAKGRFRILSLDGGGVRGCLSAAVLGRIESYLNAKMDEEKPLGEHFDFIIGTSTGGIIALALSIGLSTKEIEGFYYAHIPLIFSPTQRRNKLWSCKAPKYSSDQLQTSLNMFFGDKTLRNVKRDVCITTVALQSAAPRFYKSDYLERNAGRLDEKLVDIALATSAAPTYFKAHSMEFSSNLIDGGICANNPAMIGLIDSFQFERPSKRGVGRVVNGAGDAMMLSVGTGEQPSMPYKIDDLTAGGRLDWAMPISEVLLESQSQLIHNQAQFILKPNTVHLMILI